jgi:hypothetical protein
MTIYEAKLVSFEEKSDHKGAYKAPIEDMSNAIFSVNMGQNLRINADFTLVASTRRSEVDGVRVTTWSIVLLEEMDFVFTVFIQKLKS